MPILTFDSVSKTYGAESVLDRLDLSIDEGEFAVVYGLPGAGKSVLVRLLVGLEKIDTGTIHIRGIDADTLRPGDRNIGYVPQSFALFPDKTVRANIAYPLTLAGTKGATKSDAVETLADLLRIADLLNRRPDQLSGGQKQRVAIARGLVTGTDIYVLDDPLVGLDFKFRERLIDDLRTTRDALGATFLLATSNAGEALALGSKIAVLSDGHIVDYDSPALLYDQPQRFETMTRLCFPAPNVLSGRIDTDGGDARFLTELGDIEVSLSSEPNAGEPVVGVVRAEHIAHRARPGVAGIHGTSTVALREDLAAEEVVYLDTGHQVLTSVVRADAAHATSIELHERLDFHISAEHIVLFAGNRRIGRGTPINTSLCDREPIDG